MYRVFVVLIIALAVLGSCTKAKKPERRHSKQTVYELYLQRGINSLNQYSATHDSSQLVVARHYLDSASVQKELANQVVVPKISLFLLEKRFADGRKFVETTGEAQYPRPYMKEMYINFLDALIQNHNRNAEAAKSSMKKSVAAVAFYLQKHPNDKDAITDLFSLKIYTEPESKLVSEMQNYKTTHPESKAIIDHLEPSLIGIVKKR